jgi:hypothetical protein
MDTKSKAPRRIGTAASGIGALAIAAFTYLGSTAPAAAATCNSSPRLGSSFLEGYLPADWTAARWRTLYSNQEAACINHLILQYTAQSDPGNLITYYPPGPARRQLGFTDGGSSDIIEHALSETDKAQYRSAVVVGLQLNETEWFSSAGNAAWLDNQLIIAQTLAKEIWSKYGSHSAFDSLPADGCGTLSDWASEWQTLFQRMKTDPTKNGNLDVIA